jgi:hypothetical protein
MVALVQANFLLQRILSKCVTTHMSRFHLSLFIPLTSKLFHIALYPRILERISQVASTTLSHSFFYTFPGMGHTVIGSRACPTDMALLFLDHPMAAPDTGCLAKMSESIFVVTPR